MAARSTSRVEVEKIGPEVDAMAVSGVGMTGNGFHSRTGCAKLSECGGRWCRRGRCGCDHHGGELEVGVPLRHVADVRSGDKGDTVNVLVVVDTDDLYPILVQQLSAEQFLAALCWMGQGSGYAIRGPGRFHVELRCCGALGGGVSRSLNVETTEGSSRPCCRSSGTSPTSWSRSWSGRS